MSLILIVIIAVLALSLAILTGYLLIVQGNDGNGEAELEKDGQPINGEETIEIPSEKDLVKVSLYDSPRYFNLKSRDSEKSSIIQANVTLKCYKVLKRDKEIIISDMVKARSEEIQELIVRFFMTLTADEVKDPAIMDNAKVELANQINTLLNEGLEKTEDVVYRVVFSEWLFQ